MSSWNRYRPSRTASKLMRPATLTSLAVALAIAFAIVGEFSSSGVFRSGSGNKVVPVPSLRPVRPPPDPPAASAPPVDPELISQIAGLKQQLKLADQRVREAQRVADEKAAEAKRLADELLQQQQQQQQQHELQQQQQQQQKPSAEVPAPVDASGGVPSEANAALAAYDFSNTAIVTLAAGNDAARGVVALVSSLRLTKTRVQDIVVMLSRGGTGSPECRNEDGGAWRKSSGRPYVSCSGPDTIAEEIISPVYLETLKKLGAKIEVVNEIPSTKWTEHIPG